VESADAVSGPANSFGASDTLHPKSVAPSVEVHGGTSSKGAAICGIQASEAADEFSGSSISSGELEELQRAPTNFLYEWLALPE
jgi:hypothetical protein